MAVQNPATIGLGAGAVLVVCLLAACNLPGLPGEGGPDAGVPDGAGGDGGGRVCEPGSRQCHITGLMICAPDGRDFEIVSCGKNEVCQRGRCKAIENECDTTLPFSVSATELWFDTGPRLRPDSVDFTLENCSDREISLWDLRVRGPDRPGAAGSWRIRNAAELQKLLLGPGESIDTTVRFEPKWGFFRDSGRLEMEVRAGDNRTYPAPIRLHPRIDCATVPPRIDVGEVEVGDSATVSVPFDNCGSEDQTVQMPGTKALEEGTGWTVEYKDTGDETGDGPRALHLEADKTGEQAFVLEPSRPGRLEVPVTFRVRRDGTAMRARKVTTRLVGRAVPPECEAAGPPAVPEIRVGDGDWTARESTEARPFEPVELRPAEDGSDIDVRLVEHPEGTHVRPETGLSTAGDKKKDGKQGDEAGGWHLIPDVVGTYTLEVRRLNDHGRPGCEGRQIDINVRPEEPVYVELRWRTGGDPIGADEGYGRGMDLNLHVLPHRPGTPTVNRPVAGLEGWQNPSFDCFQRGLRADRRCGGGRGRVVAVSASGTGPEAVAFEAVDGDDFAVAVQGWNSYHFPGATASVRVFVDGEAAIESPMEGRFGTNPGTVWWVGTWDSSDEAFVEVDEFEKGF